MFHNEHKIITEKKKKTLYLHFALPQSALMVSVTPIPFVDATATMLLVNVVPVGVVESEVVVRTEKEFSMLVRQVCWGKTMKTTVVQ